MALFKLTKQDRDYYALQDLLKPKDEEQEETAGIGTKPSKQEQDEEGMFSSFFGGLFDRSEKRAQEIAKEARESALAARLTRELSGITKSLTEEDVAVRSATRDPRYGNQMPEETTLVDVTDTDMGKVTNEKPLYDLAEAVDPGTIDTSELLGKGLMSPRLDGKDGDLAESVAPFSVGEDELYNFAKEAYPDNPLAAGALLATIEAESAGGNSMLESGNYSKEAALREANKGEFKTARKREVEKIFKDPDLTYVDSKGTTRMTKEGRVKFFNIYYNDKYRGKDYKLGNTEEGDGFRFRGRGPIQLTGKANYREIGDMIGVDLVQNPQLIVTDKDVALAATKAYMKREKLDKVKTAKGLRDIVGHADTAGLPKAKARWKRAQEIERQIMRETSPRPMLRPDDFKVASN